MGRNKVIGYGQTFTEVSSDRNLNGFTRWIRHQTTHTCQLTHLRLITAGTRVSHHVDWIEWVINLVVVIHFISNVLCSLVPYGADLLITLIISNQTTGELALSLGNLSLSCFQNILLLRRNSNIRNSYGHTCNTCIVIAQILYAVNNLSSTAGSQFIKALSNQLAQLLLIHQNAQGPLASFLILLVGTNLWRQNLIEDHAAQRGSNQTIILGSTIFLLLHNLNLNFSLNIQLLMLICQQSLINTGENLALTNNWMLWRGFAQLGQVVSTQNHILGRNDNRTAILWCQNVVSGQHQDTSLSLSLSRQWQMDSHLVTIEVRVVGRASQWMELQSTALSEDWLKSLNTQTMQGWGTVQKHWMLLNNIFQHIPYLFLGTLNHTLSVLNIVSNLLTNQLLHNKWLEKLQSHFLWQTTLMELQLRAYNDNGTSRVVNTLTQQVLTETSLLTLKHIRQGLQRTIARAGYRTTTTTIINQSIYSLLQHALLVADNNVRSTKLQQTLQAVVSVDNTTIQIVQIRGSKTATIQLNHRAQLWRNNWNYIHNHPGWLVAGASEGLNNLQTTDSTNTALLAGYMLQLVSQLLVQDIQTIFHVLSLLFLWQICLQLNQKLLDSLGTHAYYKITTVVLPSLAILQLRQKLLFGKRCILWIQNNVGSKVENLLHSPWWNIQNQAHAAGDTLEIPNMRYRSSQLNMAHTLTAYLGTSDLNTTAITDSTLMTDTFILTAMTFPITSWSKNFLAEKTILLWLQSTIVNSLWLQYLAMRPLTNLVRRGQAYAH